MRAKLTVGAVVVAGMALLLSAIPGCGRIMHLRRNSTRTSRSISWTPRSRRCS